MLRLLELPKVGGRLGDSVESPLKVVAGVRKLAMLLTSWSKDPFVILKDKTWPSVKLKSSLKSLKISEKLLGKLSIANIIFLCQTLSHNILISTKLCRHALIALPIKKNNFGNSSFKVMFRAWYFSLCSTVLLSGLSPFAVNERNRA